MMGKNWLQNFARSEEDSWIGGVCGGLGEHTSIPSWTWRLLFVLLVIFSYGVVLFIYILLWIFVPPKSKTEG
jgi:phage shock protein PspC (stress-responsive transcriptional regulator)